MSQGNESNFHGESGYAYATLLTRPSYLAGAILLAYTLHQHSPSTPLVILYTPETLPEPCIKALEAEARHTNTIPYPVDHLRLPAHDGASGKGGMVAERFIDTWTKLRVFQLYDLASERDWSKLCFLDADMMIFRDPNPIIFGPDLSEGELLATHVCVCNLDHDAWAPPEWTPKNCSYVPLTKDPDGNTTAAPVIPGHATHGIMNTGTFAFVPTKEISSFVLGAFEDYGVKRLSAYKFPDQDFLNDVFSSRWRSLHWSANSLKTWRYWHKNFWVDDQVRVLHYIVDKPWAKRVETNEKGELVAGYKGGDGESHSWWWKQYERWVAQRKDQDENDEVKTVEKYVASQDGRGDDDGLRAIGGGAQDFAKKWEDGDEEHGAKKALGERGHGAVIRERGEGFSGSKNEPKLEEGAGAPANAPASRGGHGRGSGWSGRGARGSSYMADG